VSALARTVAVVVVCALAAAAAAAAQRPQQVVLPGPVPYPTESPPLAGGGVLASAYIAPGLHIASTERVRVDVGGTGKPNAIHVQQQLTVKGKGDYQVAVSGPIADVRRGPGSQSEPGFRADQVLWAGFSPGRKLLAADIALRVPPAAPYLPLRLRLIHEDGGVTLRVTNATATPVMSYEGVVRPTEMARLLDATRRSSLAGQRVKAAFATFLGTVHVPKRPLQIEAPLRVHGELDLPGRDPVTFSRVLGDGQPLSFEVHAAGSGEPDLDISAAPAPVVRLLRPPGAGTWAAAIRRRPIPGAELLSRLIGGRFRLVRADQYRTFLADPDADGRSSAVYDYERVVSTVAKSVPVPGRGGGSDALLVVLLAVGSAVVVGGGLVLWARS
jgi:hypothetical protein